MRLKSIIDSTYSIARSTLIYSLTGVGKTTSSLQSLPRPILMFKFEKRDLSDAIKIAGIKEDELFIYQFGNWDDYIDFLANPDAEEKKIIDVCKSVLVDNISHLINNLLSWEIEDETYSTKFKGTERVIVNSTRLGLDGYGALGSKICRMFDAYGKYLEDGKPVVCTALLTENPKYNIGLSAGPSFKGKMIVDNLASFFDLIGLVENNYNEDDKIVYPPIVRFKGDESFMHKYSGKPTSTGVTKLDFQIILRIKE